MDLVEVRKDISEIVGNNATDVTTAVLGEALKGQLGPMKYLFEVAGLYPATEEGGAPPEKDALARTLLHRLGLPEEPVNRPEDDLPPKPVSSDQGPVERKSKEEGSGGGSAGGGDSKDGEDEDEDTVPVRASTIP